MDRADLRAEAAHGGPRRWSPGESRSPALMPEARAVSEPHRSGPGLRPSAARPPRPPRPLVQVLLCEDQEVFRLGLRSIFEAQPDIAVIAETADLVEALELADRPGARVLVVRQALVGDSMLPLLRDRCQRGTGVLVLAETGDGDRAALMAVLQVGVRGCLPRRSAAQRLVDAVRALARHEAALDSAVTSQLVRHLTGDVPPPLQRRRVLDRLTERQRDVAELVAQGLSNEEIARRLFLSPATIKSHLAAVMRRLEVRTRTQLAIMVNRDHSPAA
jgi:DNA-binding NarL/FixJ family response regulator